ncbi:MAG: hypothetical protein CMH83_19415 [Nocardioides sp.]|nr:hypothetical protein [Nocardioides sp.]MBS45293.1 hypothetical protein [Nocardioides sp.]
MTVTLPETTKSYGTRTVYVVPEADVADPSAAATVADLTGAFKATCYLYGGGLVSGEQQKGQAPRKECEVETREQLGTINRTISALQYSYKPQADDTDPANAMKAAMGIGTRVWVAERLGVRDTQAVAADDLTNWHLVELGYQNRGMTGDGEYDEYSITQEAVVKQSIYDVALTAA